MGFGRYLTSRWRIVASCAFAFALCAMVLTVAGADSEVMLLVACVATVGLGTGLVLDWAARRPFYRELDACAQTIEHPLWSMEMVRRPDFAEGELAYDVIKTIAKCANDDVARYRRQTEDYREYIETWVHEAKTPLVASSLMVENLVEAAGGVRPQDVVQKAEGLSCELGRLEGYIDQALYYTRSETLDRDYVIRKILLRTMVMDAVKANVRTMIAAHVAPVCRGLDFEVFADEKWVVFVLGQLIQNSVKYAREDGAQIVFDAQCLDAGRANERIELVVRDNGCGAPALDMPRVFDKGFTGQNGRTGKRSTGIGLYLVKRLCDKMGLQVRAESEEGGYFEVAITFPANRPPYE